MSELRKVSIRYEDLPCNLEPSEDFFDDQEVMDLMDQILSEVFNVEEDNKESLASIEGNSIYFIETEQSIIAIESYELEKLNEGSPDIDDFQMLLELAEQYFSNPPQYPLAEEEEEVFVSYAKAFIQIYSGEKSDELGKTIEMWRSSGTSLMIPVNDLLRPELVVQQVEALGFKWSSVIRLCVYGPLREIVGEKLYLPDEAKQLVSLDDNYKNLLLAVPAFADSDSDDKSIFDFVEEQMEDNILYGTFPQYGRSLTAHWELTHSRILEIIEEELEHKNLLNISRRERARVLKKNAFKSKYADAFSIVKDVNSNKLSISELYNQDPELLKEALSLTDRQLCRIENRNTYLQIKGLVAQQSLSFIRAQQAQTLELISKINNDSFVELHLLTNDQLEDLFSVLWSNTGFKIKPEKKDVYFLLKNNLLRMRAKKARSLKN